MNDRFAAGITAYRQRRWDEAMEAFGAVLEVRPDDGSAALYVERCRKMLASSPDAAWDGVTVMDVK
jgi:adenylate cyclase